MILLVQVLCQLFVILDSMYRVLLALVGWCLCRLRLCLVLFGSGLCHWRTSSQQRILCCCWCLLWRQLHSLLVSKGQGSECWWWPRFEGWLHCIVLCQILVPPIFLCFPTLPNCCRGYGHGGGGAAEYWTCRQVLVLAHCIGTCIVPLFDVLSCHNTTWHHWSRWWLLSFFDRWCQRPVFCLGFGYLCFSCFGIHIALWQSSAFCLGHHFFANVFVKLVEVHFK